MKLSFADLGPTRINILIGLSLAVGTIGGVYLLTRKTNIISKISERKPKKKNADRCNVCFEALDPEDFKCFATCCNCGKSVCRGRQCSTWLPSQAGWECQLCNLSNESRSRASEWVQRQATEHQFLPMRTRSELHIPTRSRYGSRHSVYETTSEAPSSIYPEQKERVREYVEEIVANMLGGPLDEVPVGQLYKSRDYLPLTGSQNDYCDVSRVKLKRLIEKVIEDVLHLPALIDQRVAPPQPPIGSRADESLPPYFDPKKYQELLATAVLNKIVDSYNNEKNFNNTEKPPGSDFDKNHNTVATREKQTYSSSSSIEPHSDSSVTDAINFNRYGDFSNSDTFSNFADNVNLNNANEGDDAFLSDYLAKHQVPLPDLSMESETASEDVMSIATSNGMERSWEDNWLFKKKKHPHDSPAPVGMLVPAPKEDIRALIGDKTADEMSDLSEAGSDYEENDVNDVEEYFGPPNQRMRNKHVIGGKSTVGLFDELLEQTSMVSTSSLQDNEPAYAETRNDFIFSDDGLNEVDRPSLNLRSGSIPIETEAVNDMVATQILQNSPPKTIPTFKPCENFDEAIIEPPSDFTDFTENLNKKDTLPEHKMNGENNDEAFESGSPSSESNGAQNNACTEKSPFTTNNTNIQATESSAPNDEIGAIVNSKSNECLEAAEVSNSVADNNDELPSNNIPQEESNPSSQEPSRRSSAVEFLAVVALGPVLALSTPDNTIKQLTEEPAFHEIVNSITTNLDVSLDRMPIPTITDALAETDPLVSSNATSVDASTNQNSEDSVAIGETKMDADIKISPKSTDTANEPTAIILEKAIAEENISQNVNNHTNGAARTLNKLKSEEGNTERTIQNLESLNATEPGTVISKPSSLIAKGASPAETNKTENVDTLTTLQDPFILANTENTAENVCRPVISEEPKLEKLVATTETTAVITVTKPSVQNAEDTTEFVDKLSSPQKSKTDSQVPPPEAAAGVSEPTAVASEKTPKTIVDISQKATAEELPKNNTKVVAPELVTIVSELSVLEELKPDIKGEASEKAKTINEPKEMALENASIILNTAANVENPAASEEPKIDTQARATGTAKTAMEPSEVTSDKSKSPNVVVNTTEHVENPIASNKPKIETQVAPPKPTTVTKESFVPDEPKTDTQITAPEPAGIVREPTPPEQPETNTAPEQLAIVCEPAVLEQSETDNLVAAVEPATIVSETAAPRQPNTNTTVSTPEIAAIIGEPPVLENLKTDAQVSTPETAKTVNDPRVNFEKGPSVNTMPHVENSEAPMESPTDKKDAPSQSQGTVSEHSNPEEQQMETQVTTTELQSAASEPIAKEAERTQTQIATCETLNITSEPTNLKEPKLDTHIAAPETVTPVDELPAQISEEAPAATLDTAVNVENAAAPVESKADTQVSTAEQLGVINVSAAPENPNSDMIEAAPATVTTVSEPAKVISEHAPAAALDTLVYMEISTAPEEKTTDIQGATADPVVGETATPENPNSDIIDAAPQTVSTLSETTEVIPEGTPVVPLDTGINVENTTAAEEPKTGPLGVVGETKIPQNPKSDTIDAAPETVTTESEPTEVIPEATSAAPLDTAINVENNTAPEGSKTGTVGAVGETATPKNPKSDTIDVAPETVTAVSEPTEVVPEGTPAAPLDTAIKVKIIAAHEELKTEPVGVVGETATPENPKPDIFAAAPETVMRVSEETEMIPEGKPAAQLDTAINVENTAAPQEPKMKILGVIGETATPQNPKSDTIDAAPDSVTTVSEPTEVIPEGKPAAQLDTAINVENTRAPEEPKTEPVGVVGETTTPENPKSDSIDAASESVTTVSEPTEVIPEGTPATPLDTAINVENTTAPEEPKTEPVGIVGETTIPENPQSDTIDAAPEIVTTVNEPTEVIPEGTPAAQLDNAINVENTTAPEEPKPEPVGVVGETTTPENPKSDSIDAASESVTTVSEPTEVIPEGTPAAPLDTAINVENTTAPEEPKPEPVGIVGETTIPENPQSDTIDAAPEIVTTVNEPTEVIPEGTPAAQLDNAINVENTTAPEEPKPEPVGVVGETTTPENPKSDSIDAASESVTTVSEPTEVIPEGTPAAPLDTAINVENTTAPEEPKAEPVGVVGETATPQNPKSDTIDAAPDSVTTVSEPTEVIPEGTPAAPLDTPINVENTTAPEEPKAEPLGDVGETTIPENPKSDTIDAAPEIVTTVNEPTEVIPEGTPAAPLDTAINVENTTAPEEPKAEPVGIVGETTIPENPQSDSIDAAPEIVTTVNEPTEVIPEGTPAAQLDNAINVENTTAPEEPKPEPVGVVGETTTPENPKSDSIDAASESVMTVSEPTEVIPEGTPAAPLDTAINVENTTAPEEPKAEPVGIVGETTIPENPQSDSIDAAPEIVTTVNEPTEVIPEGTPAAQLDNAINVENTTAPEEPKPEPVGVVGETTTPENPKSDSIDAASESVTTVSEPTEVIPEGTPAAPLDTAINVENTTAPEEPKAEPVGVVGETATPQNPKSDTIDAAPDSVTTVSEPTEVIPEGTPAAPLDTPINVENTTAPEEPKAEPVGVVGETATPQNPKSDTIDAAPDSVTTVSEPTEVIPEGTPAAPLDTPINVEYTTAPEEPKTEPVGVVGETTTPEKPKSDTIDAAPELVMTVSEPTEVIPEGTPAAPLDNAIIVENKTDPEEPKAEPVGVVGETATPENAKSDTIDAAPESVTTVSEPTEVIPEGTPAAPLDTAIDAENTTAPEEPKAEPVGIVGETTIPENPKSDTIDAAPDSVTTVREPTEVIPEGKPAAPLDTAINAENTTAPEEPKAEPVGIVGETTIPENPKSDTIDAAPDSVTTVREPTEVIPEGKPAAQLDTPINVENTTPPEEPKTEPVGVVGETTTPENPKSDTIDAAPESVMTVSEPTEVIPEGTPAAPLDTAINVENTTAPEEPKVEPVGVVGETATSQNPKSDTIDAAPEIVTTVNEPTEVIPEGTPAAPLDTAINVENKMAPEEPKAEPVGVVGETATSQNPQSDTIDAAPEIVTTVNEPTEVIPEGTPAAPLDTAINVENTTAPEEPKAEPVGVVGETATPENPKSDTIDAAPETVTTISEPTEVIPEGTPAAPLDTAINVENKMAPEEPKAEPVGVVGETATPENPKSDTIDAAPESVTTVGEPTEVIPERISAAPLDTAINAENTTAAEEAKTEPVGVVGETLTQESQKSDTIDAVQESVTTVSEPTEVIPEGTPAAPLNTAINVENTRVPEEPKAELVGVCSETAVPENPKSDTIDAAPETVTTVSEPTEVISEGTPAVPLDTAINVENTTAPEEPKAEPVGVVGETATPENPKSDTIDAAPESVTTVSEPTEVIPEGTPAAPLNTAINVENTRVPEEPKAELVGVCSETAVPENPKSDTIDAAPETVTTVSEPTEVISEGTPAVPLDTAINVENTTAPEEPKAEPVGVVGETATPENPKSDTIDAAPESVTTVSEPTEVIPEGTPAAPLNTAINVENTRVPEEPKAELVGVCSETAVPENPKSDTIDAAPETVTTVSEPTEVISEGTPAVPLDTAINVENTTAPEEPKAEPVGVVGETATPENPKSDTIDAAPESVTTVSEPTEVIPEGTPAAPLNTAINVENTRVPEEPKAELVGVCSETAVPENPKSDTIDAAPETVTTVSEPTEVISEGTPAVPLDTAINVENTTAPEEPKTEPVGVVGETTTPENPKSDTIDAAPESVMTVSEPTEVIPEGTPAAPLDNAIIVENKTDPEEPKAEPVGVVGETATPENAKSDTIDAAPESVTTVSEPTEVIPEGTPAAPLDTAINVENTTVPEESKAEPVGVCGETAVPENPKSDTFDAAPEIVTTVSEPTEVIPEGTSAAPLDTAINVENTTVPEESRTEPVGDVGETSTQESQKSDTIDAVQESVTTVSEPTEVIPEGTPAAPLDTAINVENTTVPEEPKAEPVGVCGETAVPENPKSDTIDAAPETATTVSEPTEVIPEGTSAASLDTVINVENTTVPEESKAEPVGVCGETAVPENPKSDTFDAAPETVTTVSEPTEVIPEGTSATPLDTAINVENTTVPEESRTEPVGDVGETSTQESQKSDTIDAVQESVTTVSEPTEVIPEGTPAAPLDTAINVENTTVPEEPKAEPVGVCGETAVPENPKSDTIDAAPETATTVSEPTEVIPEGTSAASLDTAINVENTTVPEESKAEPVGVVGETATPENAKSDTIDAAPESVTTVSEPTEVIPEGTPAALLDTAINVGNTTTPEEAKTEPVGVVGETATPESAKSDTIDAATESVTTVSEPTEVIPEGTPAAPLDTAIIVENKTDLEEPKAEPVGVVGETTTPENPKSDTIDAAPESVMIVSEPTEVIPEGTPAAPLDTAIIVGNKTDLEEPKVEPVGVVGETTTPENPKSDTIDAAPESVMTVSEPTEVIPEGKPAAPLDTSIIVENKTDPEEPKTEPVGVVGETATPENAKTDTIDAATESVTTVSEPTEVIPEGTPASPLDTAIIVENTTAPEEPKAEPVGVCGETAVPENPKSDTFDAAPETVTTVSEPTEVIPEGTPASPLDTAIIVENTTAPEEPKAEPVGVCGETAVPENPKSDTFDAAPETVTTVSEPTEVIPEGTPAAPLDTAINVENKTAPEEPKTEPIGVVGETATPENPKSDTIDVAPRTVTAVSEPTEVISKVTSPVAVNTTEKLENSSGSEERGTRVSDPETITTMSKPTVMVSNEALPVTVNTTEYVENPAASLEPISIAGEPAASEESKTDPRVLAPETEQKPARVISDEAPHVRIITGENVENPTLPSVVLSGFAGVISKESLPTEDYIAAEVKMEAGTQLITADLVTIVNESVESVSPTVIVDNVIAPKEKKQNTDSDKSPTIENTNKPIDANTTTESSTVTSANETSLPQTIQKLPVAEEQPSIVKEDSGKNSSGQQLPLGNIILESLLSNHPPGGTSLESNTDDSSTTVIDMSTTTECKTNSSFDTDSSEPIPTNNTNTIPDTDGTILPDSNINLNLLSESSSAEEDPARSLKHLIPGSIAEREHKKWYNAVEMPNNPYAPEALIRRLSDGPERPIDIPTKSPVLEKPCSEEEAKDLNSEENNEGKVDYKRYSRDYYINDSKHASGSKQYASATKLWHSRSIDGDKEIPTKQNVQQASGEDKQQDIFFAKPIRVDECDPILSKATKVEHLSTPERDYYILPNDEAFNLKRSSTPSDHNSSQTSDSLPTSEDSDTVRIYDLNKQETRIIKEDTPKTPSTNPTRPTVLSFSPKTPATTKLGTPTKVLTPPALRFLQPKRKLFDPKFIMAATQDKTSPIFENKQVQTPSNDVPEKLVIEEEVASSLPSVKALAKVFLMASSKTSAATVHKPKVKLRVASSWKSIDQRNDAPAEEEPKKLDAAPGPSPLSYSPPYEQTYNPAAPLEIPQVVEEVIEEKQLESQSPQPEEQPPSSPALIPGQLRNSIAFFENLKNK